MIVEALPLSEQPVFWTGERVEGRFGFTLLSDEITIFSDTPGITPGITGGTVSFFFDVTGTVSNSLNLLPDRSSSVYRVNELSSTLSLGLDYISTSFGLRSEDIVDEEISLPSPLTFPTENYTPANKIYNQTIEVAVPFIYGESGRVAIGGFSRNIFRITNFDGADNFRATLNVDFDDTVILKEAIVFDENGNRDTGAVIDSDLGIDYLATYTPGSGTPTPPDNPTPPPAASVPEPATILGSMVALAVGYTTRRRRLAEAKSA
jgi:hypothetical protein